MLTPAASETAHVAARALGFARFRSERSLSARWTWAHGTEGRPGLRTDAVEERSGSPAPLSRLLATGVLALCGCAQGSNPEPSGSYDGRYVETRQSNLAGACGITATAGRTAADIAGGTLRMQLFNPATKMTERGEDEWRSVGFRIVEEPPRLPQLHHPSRKDRRRPADGDSLRQPVRRGDRAQEGRVALSLGSLGRRRAGHGRAAGRVAQGDSLPL